MGILSNFVYVGQGYFLGILVPDENNVKIVNMLFVMIFVTTNGVLANLNTVNWFIKGLSYISPLRFCCEGFVRSLTYQIPNL